MINIWGDSGVKVPISLPVLGSLLSNLLWNKMWNADVLGEWETQAEPLTARTV